MRISKKAVVWILALTTVGCDRVTKHLASAWLANTPAQSFVMDTVRFEYAENTGAFLSLGSGLSDSLRFSIFSFGVGAALLLLLFIAVRQRWSGLPLAGATLVLAGGASNLVDRLIHGSVIDFVSIGVAGVRTGIFNVADVAIMIGGLLIVAGTRERKSTEARNA